MTVSLVLSAALASLGNFFGGFLPAPEFILHGIDFILSAGIIGVLFAAMYRFLPNTMMARCPGRSRCHLAAFQCRKDRTRALYWKIRCRIIVRGGRIDTGAAPLDLLFRTDFLFRSGIHEILCERYESRLNVKPMGKRSVPPAKNVPATNYKK